MNVTQSEVTSSNAECPSYDSDVTEVSFEEEVNEPQAKRRRGLAYIKLEKFESMDGAKTYLKQLDKPDSARWLFVRKLEALSEFQKNNY